MRAPRLNTAVLTGALGLIAILLVACGPTAPVASFTASPLSGDAPLTVYFTDTSEDEPTEWLWDFGDGGVTSGQDPVHTYDAPGSYQVRLTATNEGGAGEATISQPIEVGPGPVARAELSVSEVSLSIGRQQAFEASAWDEFGNEIASPEVAWSASAGAIDASGRLTAGTVAGTFGNGVTAQVSHGGATATATASVTVAPDPVATIGITPAGEVSLSIGRQQTFEISAQDRFGNEIANPRIRWSSSAGEIDASGRLTAGTAAGTFDHGVTATVSHGGSTTTATASVTVLRGPMTGFSITPESEVFLSIGQQQTFEISAHDQFGNEIANPEVRWSSSAGEIDASGLLTAGTAAGTFDHGVAVTVSHDGLTAARTVPVTIAPDPLAAAAISPASGVLLSIGQQQTFEISARDEFGNEIAGPEVRWSSSAGEIDASGQLAAGTAAGTFDNGVTARVSYGGAALVATAPLTIVPDPLAEVSIAPEEISAPTGSDVQLTALAADRYGNALTPSHLMWETASGVGSINFDGLLSVTTVAGKYPASVQAVAWLDGVVVSGSVDVTVTPGLIGSLDIRGIDGPLRIGQTVPLSLAGFDSFGNEIAFEDAVWSTTGANAVDPETGVLRVGSEAGTFVLEARLPSGEAEVVETLTYRVLPGPLANVNISSPALVVEAGESLQLTALATDEHGNVLSGFDTIWDSPTSGADVDQSGLLTAGKVAGAYDLAVRVDVSLDGVTAEATADVVVTPAPLAQVAWAPKAVTVGIGQRQRFVAVAGDRFGNRIPGASFEWALSAEEAGTLTSDGFFTAGDAPGEYEVAVTAAMDGATAAGQSTVAVEPDRIMFLSDSDHEDFIDLYWVTPDGTETRRITRSQSTEYDAEWAPDGRRVVYTSDAGLIVSADDGDWPDLIHEDSLSSDPLTLYTEPAWSPLGDKIVYVKIIAFTLEDGEFDVMRDLYVSGIDGGNETRLTETDDDEYAPSWSPDGARIVYDRTTESTSGDIWVINADGSGAREVYASESNETHPRFSPGGASILFTSEADGDYEIYVIGADGEGLLQLTDNDAHDANPTWSPDGTQITFGSDRDDEHGDIYVMNADGSDVKRIVEGVGHDFEPHWAPRKRGVRVDENALGLPSVEPPGDLAIAAITAAARGAIVRIETDLGGGSGFVFDPSGLVITDNHVITDAAEIHITTGDGFETTATIVGRDMVRDIAVLRMADTPDGLAPLPFSGQGEPELGSGLLVLGFPLLANELNVTQGIVSANLFDSGRTIQWVQTDAAINPGNSGGPVLNLQGQVIGLAAAKAVGISIEGIAFAISDETILAYLNRIIAGETIGQDSDPYPKTPDSGSPDDSDTTDDPDGADSPDDSDDSGV